MDDSKIIEDLLTSTVSALENVRGDCYAFQFLLKITEDKDEIVKINQLLQDLQQKIVLLEQKQKYYERDNSQDLPKNT